MAAHPDACDHTHGLLVNPTISDSAEIIMSVGIPLECARDTRWIIDGTPSNAQRQKRAAIDPVFGAFYFQEGREPSVRGVFRLWGIHLVQQQEERGAVMLKTSTSTAIPSTLLGVERGEVNKKNMIRPRWIVNSFSKCTLKIFIVFLSVFIYKLCQILDMSISLSRKKN